MKTSFNFTIGQINVNIPRSAGGGNFEMGNLTMAGEVEYSASELEALIDNSEKTMAAMGTWIDGKMPNWLERMGNSIDKVRRQSSATCREMRKLDDDDNRARLLADQKAHHDRVRDERKFQAELDKSDN